MPGSPRMFDNHVEGMEEQNIRVHGYDNVNFTGTDGDFIHKTVNKPIGDSSLHTVLDSSLSGSECPKQTQAVSVVRVWTALAVYMFCYNTAFMATIPVTAQYLTHRISEDWYNFTNFTREIPCTKEKNDSNTHTRDEIQKVVSSLSLFINYASSIPAIFTCLPIGTLSDHIGRKKVILFPMFGGFVRTLVYLIVVSWDLNLNYLFIGSVVDGLCGSYHANSLLSAALVADITTSAGIRAISFAIIECLVILSSAGSSLAVGYFIELEGYVYPTAMMTILVGIAILAVLFILPETLQTYAKMTLNPLKHVKRAASFYISAGSPRKRVLYRVGGLMFFLNIVVSIGRSPVETLYELNSPFCWESFKIGIFSSIQSSVQIICSIFALKILKTWLRLETIGIIALVCAIGGYVLEGLATVDLMIYMVPVVGLIIYTVTPITRTLLSRMSLQSEQGALFASLSVLDAICGILSYTIYNSIYIATLSFYRGTVFFVMGGICAFNIILFLIFRTIHSKYDASETLLTEPEHANENDKETKQYGSLNRPACYDC